MNKVKAIEKLTNWYFAPKSFEKDGKLYEALGVEKFKKLVLMTAGQLVKLVFKENLGPYFIGSYKEINEKTIKKHELWARFNELIHITLNIPLLHGLVENLGNDNYSSAIECIIALLINNYCVMLQRYNRVRIFNILEKKSSNTKIIS